jgi:hypothetical protein
VTPAKKLSGRARAKLGALEAARHKWEHVRALVEQATAGQSGAFALGDRGGNQLRRLTRQIARAAFEASQLCADYGFSALAEDMKELPTLARRGEAIRRAALLRMREVVGNVLAGMDRAEKKLREDPRANGSRAGKKGTR